MPLKQKQLLSAFCISDSIVGGWCPAGKEERQGRRRIASGLSNHRVSTTVTLSLRESQCTLQEVLWSSFCDISKKRYFIISILRYKLFFHVLTSMMMRCGLKGAPFLTSHSMIPLSITPIIAPWDRWLKCIKGNSRMFPCYTHTQKIFVYGASAVRQEH